MDKKTGQFHSLILVISLVCLSDILSNGDTNVLFGQNAFLSCALSDPSGVKQVTWERVRADKRLETLATFSERFKHHVDDQYIGKVSLTMASFNSTSIVIRNVTFEDEACYICSFNAYPLGPKRETLCLTVKGISEITVSKNQTSESDVTISCSATGKPPPILQWKSTAKDLNLKLFGSNNSTKLNSDGSSTTRSDQKLSSSQFHGKNVECVAQSDNIEEMYQIFLPGGGDSDQGNNITLRTYTITISLLTIIIFVIVIIYLYSTVNDKEKVKQFACIA